MEVYAVSNSFSEGKEDEPFKYSTLEQPRHIRLLQVSSDETSNRLLCKFTHTSLDNLTFRYLAFSYCWGDPTPTDKVWCSEHRYLNINSSAAAMLRCIVRGKGTEHVWIDALCIDQSNLVEKGQQVRLMRDIYQSATRVNAWVGNSSADSSLAMAFADTLFNTIQKICSLGQTITMATLTESPYCAFPSPNWAALVTFLQRPWFRRAWVVQEVVVASQTTIICGDWTLAWDVLASSITLILGSGLVPLLSIFPESEIGIQSTGSSNLGIIAGIRYLRKLEMPVRLQYCLLTCRQFKATDSRDMVFAMLGMASDASDAGLDPNYRLTAQSVFTDSTRHLLTRDKSLDILHAAGTGFPRFLADLPSWVPDWSAMPSTTILGHVADASGYCAAGGSGVKIQSDSSSRSVTLEGTLIDILKEVCSQRPPQTFTLDPLEMKPSCANLLGWYEGNARLVSSLQPYPSGEHWEEAFWRTLIANLSHVGKPGAPAPPVYYHYYQSLLTILRSFVKNGGPDPFEDVAMETIQKAQIYNSSVSRVSTHRLFITGRGYIGLGPPGMSANDVICIIHGAVTPFLIRAEVSEKDTEQTYTLVGECYVHGLMNGEGLKLSEPQDIVLS